MVKPSPWAATWAAAAWCVCAAAGAAGTGSLVERALGSPSLRPSTRAHLRATDDGPGRATFEFDRPAAPAELDNLAQVLQALGAGHAVDCVNPDAVKGPADAACRVYAAAPDAPPPPKADPAENDARARRIRARIANMSLDEMIDLTTGVDGFHTRAIAGLPAMRMTDGGLGVRGGQRSGRATAFPAGISLAASFDPELTQEVAGAIAREAKDRGFNAVLGPDVNIVRTPVGGRDFEMLCGEDPYLCSRLAQAYVRGIQDQGVIAVVKHLIGNELEADRTRTDSRIDERTLHEIYLPPFAAAVRAGVLCVMTSYNKLNGQHTAENKALVTGLLREELGFQGCVMSDWWGMRAGVATAEAGSDLEMPQPHYFNRSLREAVLNGIIPVGRIQEMDYHILRALDRIGLLDRPQGSLPPWPTESPRAHIELALKAAEESLVLAKNDRGLLPLDAKTLKSLAVIGPDAAVYHAGGGSSGVTPFHATTPLEGLARSLGRSVSVRFAAGVRIPGDKVPPGAPPWSDDSGIKAAARAAAAADAAVVFVGDRVSEDFDRPSFSLPGRQDELVAAVAKANPRTVVVALTGAAVAMPWADQVRAILVAWYPGQEEGTALARVLFGGVNPSGKLPVTFPRRWEDTPAAGSSRPGPDLTIPYREGVYVGYRHFDKEGLQPLFPFGHGLSYTAFAYSGLTVDAASDRAAKPGPKVTVRLRVANAGRRAGTEVVQLYVGAGAAPDGVDRPPQELKGFQRVDLGPGETKTVSFFLDEGAFSFWHPVKKQWTVEPGWYSIRAGSSSRDIRLQTRLGLR